MFNLKNVQLSFSEKPLFSSFNLSIKRGEIRLLQAESGAGKTSLLRWIAGIPDTGLMAKGAIFLNGKDITYVPAEKRKIGILFSEPLLFPHLSIAENLGVGLASSVRGKQRKEIIKNSLNKAGLCDLTTQDPLSLSTGQQARVGLLRALLSEPELLLLDEPFSSLDEDVRESMITYVLSEIKRLNIPVLIVSHDPRDHLLSSNPVTRFT